MAGERPWRRVALPDEMACIDREAGEPVHSPGRPGHHDPVHARGVAQAEVEARGASRLITSATDAPSRLRPCPGPHDDLRPDRVAAGTRPFEREYEPVPGGAPIVEIGEPP